jgi:hypothetical protein
MLILRSPTEHRQIKSDLLAEPLSLQPCCAHLLVGAMRPTESRCHPGEFAIPVWPTLII